MANIRQYSPIWISNNIDQADWPILNLKTTLHPRDAQQSPHKKLAVSAIDVSILLTGLT
jgi:hypothetical protein